MRDQSGRPGWFCMWREVHARTDTPSLSAWRGRCRGEYGSWEVGGQKEVLGHHQGGEGEDQHEAGGEEKQYRGWVSVLTFWSYIPLNVEEYLP